MVSIIFLIKLTLKPKYLKLNCNITPSLNNNHISFFEYYLNIIKQQHFYLEIMFYLLDNLYYNKV